MLYKPGYKASLEYKEFEIWCVSDWLSLRLGKVEMGKFENMQGKFEIGEVEIG